MKVCNTEISPARIDYLTKCAARVSRIRAKIAALEKEAERELSIIESKAGNATMHRKMGRGRRGRR